MIEASQAKEYIQQQVGAYTITLHAAAAKQTIVECA